MHFSNNSFLLGAIASGMLAPVACRPTFGQFGQYGQYGQYSPPGQPGQYNPPSQPAQSGQSGQYNPSGQTGQTGQSGQSTCSSYTIISTRGTGEPQGPSSGFRTMNSNTLSQRPGGKVYNTIYAADASQESSAGSRDIVNHIQQTLATNPGECFILQGYSQGASATVTAMSQINGASFDAVKGVFLIGDPQHKAGLACNIDSKGGSSTMNVNGLETFGANRGIPANWVAKTDDVCAYGDGVCDTTHGQGINAEHLSYPYDSGVQDLGTKFAIAKLSSS